MIKPIDFYIFVKWMLSDSVTNTAKQTKYSKALEHNTRESNAIPVQFIRFIE